MSEWRPIDTATKTGYKFGAWQDGSRWFVRQMWWDDAVDEWTCVSSDRYLKPTHWAPLPDAAPATENPLARHAFAMSESHLSGYRLCVGFETLEQVQAAHQYVADCGRELAARLAERTKAGQS